MSRQTLIAFAVGALAGYLYATKFKGGGGGRKGARSRAGGGAPVPSSY